MSNEKINSPSNSKLKKVGKVFLFGFASMIALIYVINVIWKSSGSAEWEMEYEQNGIKIYSFKEPGTYNKRVRGVMEGEYSLTHMAAALMLDNDSLDNCKDWIPECIELVELEPFTEEKQGDAILWTLELLPPVFTNREYLIKSHVTQDEESKRVAIDIVAAANKIPLNDCCIRIKHIHNRWEISPLDNGKVQIQITQDFNMGGMFPAFLINLGVADETYKLLHDKLPALIDKPRYRNARFDFIEEVDDRYLGSL